ncbi:MAG: fibronectin type III domain-containing protein [Candidatus Treponema excrementipullorum]|nr:fibronectin type III domain-containing protein [Candidatus Treponema excrementipullorum]
MEKRYIAHKKSFIKLSTALLFVSSVFLMSCKQVLLPQPGGFDQSKNSSGSITTEWTAPTDLKVTQGLQGRIELTWKPVLNAVRYFMYRSDTPFGNFVQVGETTDALYTQKVTAGTDTYYKITAVNLQNQETDYSVAVRGTSLAQPVISDIQGDAQEGDSTVTVYWYMNNVDAYADAVRYELVCYDATGKEQKRIPGESGNKTELTVTGLTPNTTYLYQVESYNIAEQDKTEASDKIDAQTARRLRPNPPENLTVSQGAFGDKVEVSFVLPTKVDVAVEKNVYEQFPLYFKIYRKVAGEDDSTYEPVCGYFGSIKGNADKNGGVCFADQYTPTDPDAPYQEGETVTWTDSTVVRGRQYQYKVQSYTDIETRVITSDKSVATSEPGWAVAPLSFEMNPVIYDDEYDDDGNPVSHKTAKLSATLTFDTLGKADSYTYELTVNYRRRNNGDGSLSESTPTKLGDFFTVDELSDHIYKADLHANPGSYSFTVNAKHKTSGWTESITTPNSRYVVPDLQPLIVQNLVVQDGYPDKFVLTWDRDPSVTYEIKYKMEDAQGGDYTLIEPVLADEGAEPGQTQPFEYPLTHYDGSQGKNAVTSGDALRIEIVPYTDYQGDNHKAGTPESPDQLFYTLGTPAVTFDQTKTAADSITVTWPKIEKATSYEVTYAYDGVSDTTQVLRDGAATTFADAYKADTQIIPVTKEEEIQVTDNITCVIPKPIGYDYMAYSGKDVTVTVKAINETRKTETKKTITTRTLGPAATGVKATVASKEKIIDVSWEKVPGASGYLIARTRYGATNTDDSRSTDGEFVYFYDGSNLSVVGQEAQIGSTVTLQNGTFTLTDTYTDSTGIALDNPTRKFRIEQDKLGWGYPYRYQVFPINITAKSTTFDRSKNLNLCTVTTRTTSIDKTGQVTYPDGEIVYQDADRNYATGSAIGYGLDVKATKAESADTVTVTWTKPYLEDNTTLKPVLLRIESGSTEKSWKSYSQADLETDLNKATVHLSGDMINRNKAYDYVIKYVPSGSSGFSYDPLAAYIEAQKGDKTLNEPANKGYFFSVIGAEATKTDIKDGGVSTFAEELAITPYNWTERKNGPEEYKIYIKNNNIGKNADGEVWHLVATVPVRKDSYGTPTVSVSDIKVTVSGSNLRFTPDFDKDVHGGLLKVLRDYKHYYKVEAVRTITDSDGVATEISTVLGDDDSIWGARQITAKEMVKAVTLAMSDGLYLVNGTAWNTANNSFFDFTRNENAVSPGTGSVYAECDFGVKNWDIVYTNYKPALQSKGGGKNTFLTINGTLNPKTSAVNQYPQKYESSNYLDVSGPTDVNGMYTGKIKFNSLTKSSSQGISVQYPQGSSDVILGDVTPLPFSGHDYLNDSEEWK